MAGSRHSEADMNIIRRARVMSQKSYDSMMEFVKALGDDGADPLAISALKDDGEYTPAQVAQIDAYESIVTQYGKFGQALTQAHYIPADKNVFGASGVVCANCAFYMESGGCEIVYGAIDPGAICKLWVIPNGAITETPAEPPTDAPMMDMGEPSGETEIDIEIAAIEDRNTTPAQREEMPDSDFVIPETRNFPIVTPGDIPAAVSSWGRYQGPVSFDTFKRRIIEIATRKGPEFFARLPETWRLELEQRKSYARELLRVMGVNRD